MIALFWGARLCAYPIKMMFVFLSLFFSLSSQHLKKGWVGLGSQLRIQFEAHVLLTVEKCSYLGVTAIASVPLQCYVEARELSFCC
jgi:hypothetical protein